MKQNVMICLSPSPSNTKVIRTAARMAEAFGGQLTALYVETPSFSEMSPTEERRLKEHLHLAEQLGAQIATVYGDSLAVQIAEYAKISDVSKIVLGRTNERKGLFRSRHSLMDELTALAPDMDIYIIPADRETTSHRRRRRHSEFTVEDTVRTVVIFLLTLLTAWGFSMLQLEDSGIITLFVLGVLIISVNTNAPLYGMVAAVAGAIAFIFFFTPPYYAFFPVNAGHTFTFVLLFISSMIASTLTIRVKDQARLAARKSYRTQVLLETSQMLQRAVGEDEILRRTACQVSKLLGRSVVVYPTADSAPIWFPIRKEEDLLADFTGEKDQRAVAWAWENHKQCGASTGNCSDASCLYMGVRNSSTVFALIGVALGTHHFPDVFEKNLLIALLNEAALAMEKEQLERQRQKIALQAKQEQLRANLLRAISHDLRTPLTGISGNAGLLMKNSLDLKEEKKQQLYTDIYDDSIWLIKLVENLLSVTRIENNTMSLHLEPELVDEVMDEVMAHINRHKEDHVIQVDVPEDLIMVAMDSRLIVQVLVNLLDNAVKYTPPGSFILLCAKREGDSILFSVTDNGNGIPKDQQSKVFDIFYTDDTNRADGRRGIGLGLALCKSIITAHGSRLTLEENSPHGCIFSFSLPIESVN